MKNICRKPVYLLAAALSCTAVALPCWGQSAYNLAVLADNPAYYWTFDEAGIVNAVEQVNGLAADEFIPGPNSAKVASTTTADGVSLGQAVQIVGTGGYPWNVADLSGSGMTGAWAYELWANADDITTYEYMVGSNAVGGFNNETIFKWGPGAPNPAGIQLYNGGGVIGPPDTPALTPGWHHYVFVSDGATANYDTYIDGDLWDTVMSGANHAPHPEVALKLGSWTDEASAETFDGLLDELAIYDLSGAADLADAGSAIAAHYFVGGDVEPIDVSWTGPTGFWDVGRNWTPSFVPSTTLQNVLIDPPDPVLVIGSAEDRVVDSLLVSGANLPDPGAGEQPSFVELRLQAGQTINANMGVTIANRGRISGSGTLNGIVTVAAGAEMITLTGDTLAIPFAQPNDGTITSQGTLTFSAPLTNNVGGVINAIGGRLNFNGGLTNNGRLNLVNATVTGSINGPTAALALAGSNTVDGNVNGDFDMNVEIRDNQGDHDRLTVTGTATLDGTLDIRTWDTYSDPVTRGARDNFPLVTAGEIVGVFETVIFDGATLAEDFTDLNGSFRSHAGAGLFHNVTYSETSVELSNYLALPGDANGDFTVNELDLEIWDTHKFTDGTNWISADFNADGVTDVSDFNIWNDNKFTSAAASPNAVPEPASIVLLFLAACCVRPGRRPSQVLKRRNQTPYLLKKKPDALLNRDP